MKWPLPLLHSKKVYPVNNKDPRLTVRSTPELDLTTAVEQFIQQGGVIHVVPSGATAEVSVEPISAAPPEAEGEDDQQKKNWNN